ncbi:MAG: hypothetical protein CVT89_00725 [Candidatus Altiarchaeales archaeon HGW-Altiarchaeales-2]|nr:MAG: hypothetical protein CVT89_00725 [Candidatus Altiarchaeales archaeon HGW-Altiarchaeales-2]
MGIFDWIFGGKKTAQGANCPNCGTLNDRSNEFRYPFKKLSEETHTVIIAASESGMDAIPIRCSKCGTLYVGVW